MEECIHKYSIDIIHFEHFFYTKYAFSVTPGIKKVVVYHDLHHSLYRQLIHLEKKKVRKFLMFLAFIKNNLDKSCLRYLYHSKVVAEVRDFYQCTDCR